MQKWNVLRELVIINKWRRRFRYVNGRLRLQLLLVACQARFSARKVHLTRREWQHGLAWVLSWYSSAWHDSSSVLTVALVSFDCARGHVVDPQCYFETSTWDNVKGKTEKHGCWCNRNKNAKIKREKRGEREREREREREHSIIFGNGYSRGHFFHIVASLSEYRKLS